MFINEMYKLFTNCVGCVGWNGKIAKRDRADSHYNHQLLKYFTFKWYKNGD